MANDIIRKLSDFDGINSAIENKEDLAAYTVTATGFSLKAEVTDSDYISVSTDNGKADVVNLSVNLNQSEQYTGAIDRIQGILTVLGDTLTVDESTMVELQKILVSGDRSDVNVSAEGAATVKASIDAKHNINYVIFPAMIVANSLPQDSALRSELVAGIQDVLDGNGQNALKTAVEKVTSQQLFTALKGLTAKPIFQAQANKLGLSITLNTETTALMNSFGDLLYAAGRGLSYAKINGNSGTLAGLKTDTYGEYNIKYVDKVLDITRSAKMLTGTAKATLNIDLMAALFTEEKDIVVKDHTGAYLYNGNDLAEALAVINNDTEGVTLVLNNKSQTLTGDLEISVPLTIEGYELILDGHQFVLSETTASVTMDGITEAMVESGVDGWYVDVTENKAYLVQYPVKLNGIPYKDLDVALAMLNGQDTLEILANVTLTKDVDVTGTLTITGADKLDQAGFNFVLKNTTSKLVSDAPLNVTTDLTGYVVNQEGFTYTVVAKTPAVVDKGYLKLDIHPDGIKALQMQAALRKILNKPNATVTVENGGLTNAGLVKNGAVVMVADGNELYKYTIIVMGDTNCNGETDAGDMVLMRRHFQGVITLTGVARIAADTSMNGEVDAGDMVRNRRKFQNWAGYESKVIKVDF